MPEIGEFKTVLSLYKNKKRLIFVLLGLLLVLSWAGNIIYFFAHELSEPIFLKHYITGKMYPKQNLMIDLYYLTNRSEDPDVVSIEIPHQRQIWTNFQTLKNSDYGHYVLKTARLTIDYPFFELFPEGLKIDKLTFHLKNGKTMNVDIGGLIIEPSPELKGNSAVTKTSGKPALRNVSSGSSNHNTGFQSFLAEESITIQEVEFPWEDILGDSVHIYAKVSKDDPRNVDVQRNVFEENSDNGRRLDDTLFPLRLAKGEVLTFSYQFEPNIGKSRSAFDFLRAEGKIRYLTEDKKQEQSGFLLNSQPPYEPEAVHRILEERRGNNEQTSGFSQNFLWIDVGPSEFSYRAG